MQLPDRPDANMEQLTWPQSPPMTIPMGPMTSPRTLAPAIDFLMDAVSPQLSFEAREGQMLVQAYYMQSRSRVESLDPKDQYAGYVFSPQATRSYRDDDDDTIFRLEL
ncbi:hypothetical protein SPRG_11792 [Saprolegnia parasitica CBS 223.65]|uniref:Uncharacterized protein n=1 Tax=Saprolegnia parasitica (strain CBS 223.65) TaxID=695850 RepID=A0A067C8R6_SAPPC|nr:hypothetical protein SPRG_11792 [Saprolegnia parasitica CBS 223.65]KDO22946.1 hypothetical protein SPRG_11792 [Saprolegnia parasitica CBS 223.65]|eukprot:XP_012206382.1 hypothetical protein SPRG_11792 [Saprolegnia parasitica CBS 223.65]